MSRIKCFFLEESGAYRQIKNASGEVTAMLPLYRRSDTGEEILLSDAPVGAMWFGPWYDHALFAPQLAHVLIVKTPGGEWVVDSQSANCGMPDDFKQKRHHCWIIEGSLPETPSRKKAAPASPAARARLRSARTTHFYATAF